MGTPPGGVNQGETPALASTLWWEDGQSVHGLTCGLTMCQGAQDVSGLRSLEGFGHRFQVEARGEGAGLAGNL